MSRVKYTAVAGGLIALVLALPASAAASQGSGGPGLISYSASSGETNNLLVTESGSVLVFRETGSVQISGPSGSCTIATTAHANDTLICPISGNPGVVITLGDGDDSIIVDSSVTANLASFVVDGGTGADSIISNSSVPVTASYSSSTNGVTVSLSTTDPQSTGEGVDTLMGVKNLNGSVFADTLTPTSGGSTVAGSGGNDTLMSGPGNDIYDGGTGLNTVDYSNQSNAINADLTTGTASGAGTDTLISIFNLVGSPAGDNLTGDSSPNVIDGGGGNDTLAGRGGTDVLDGGSGTNFASYSGAAGGVNVDLATGAATDDGEGASDILTNIQNAIGSPNSDIIEGDDQANVLEGGPGGDTLKGDGGPDQIDGGLGSDTVSYVGASGPVVVDLGAGTGSGDGNDTLTSIENATGSNYGDELTAINNGGSGTLNGGGGDDTLTARSSAGAVLNGDAGDDDLVGNFGPDVLSGGSGDDSLYGAGGANTLDGGVGSDTLNDSASPQAESVNLQAGTGASGNGTDVVSNIENVVGSSQGDALIGDGNANSLDGGPGDDFVSGGGGDDNLVGGTGNDTASFGGASPVAASLTTGTATGQGADTLAGFENLEGSSAGDQLVGDGGDNILNGEGGNDDLDGAGGNDQLTGGGGNDTADFSSSPGGVVADLQTNTATGDGTDALSGIANLTGSPWDDELDGDGNANTIAGGAGGDTINPGGGADTVSAGIGDDIVLTRDSTADQVGCGVGSDSVTADVADVVNADCENVSLPDTTGPTVKITSEPAKQVKITTKKTRVSFGFTSEPGATFKCKLDSGSAKACTSPKSYSVGVGKHTFKVTATDTNANVGPPARYTFKVVRK